nr:Vacuolar protein sorting-associated protein like [Ipomoea batatas]
MLDPVNKGLILLMRIQLSMNGIDNIKPRLLSKVYYILSSRKKIIWDASFAAAVINFPWKNANSKVHKLVFILIHN